MRFLFVLLLAFAAFITITCAATTYELEAKKFTDDASARFYKLYDQIADETYSSSDDEDFDEIFTKIETVKRIAQELVQISEEAGEFDANKVKDANIQHALKNLRKVGDLFVLGEDYFSTLISLAALQELSKDKDIEPYLGGANMPNQDDSALAYYPDILKVFQRSTDQEELKYYWEAWRDKNSVWASVNFYALVEAFQKASNIIGVPVLELWYGSYDNKDFINVLEKVMQDIKPAYQQLHAFIRCELNKKYGSEVVDPNGPIPDHLFEQVLAQVWKEGSVIESYFPYKELPPYDEFVQNYEAKQVVDEAERFYSSLNFAPLDEDFYRNQLKEHDEDENSGDCRADIFDLTPHVYMKYCQKVDFRKFLQMHGYLSRVHYAKEKKHLPSYYFDSYDLQYPVGEAVILSASTPKHLSALGLAKDFQFTEKVLLNRLFRMGIHTIVNLPVFYVNIKILNDLLNGTVEMDSANKHYWELMEEYVGVEPPSDRTENAIDFPYKFYLDMEQNHQTKKLISEVLGYQFYRAFCKKSGQSGQLHNCDFHGNIAIGDDLRAMMALGSSKPLSEVLAKVLPNNSQPSGDALLEYYTPILDWVKAKNKEHNVKIGWNASKKKVL